MGYIFSDEASEMIYPDIHNIVPDGVMDGGIYFGRSTFENHNISPGDILSGNNFRKHHRGKYSPSAPNADGRLVRDDRMATLLSYRIGTYPIL